MKILGLEIKKADDASNTKSFAEKSIIKKGLEVGDTGTEITKGFITSDYNPKLSGSASVKIYDEMRKSDGTVRSVLSACTLPIRKANWYVEPASQEPADIEIAEFINNCLFDYQSISWDDILRQALLSLAFGVMTFEKVFSIKNVNGVDRIIWDKFAPRLTTSIQSWETADGVPGIQQRKSDGELVSIPMEKLIVFVNEMEGKNWWGTSILRAAYKHWYFKNNLYKIDVIAAERQGLGVPFVKLPEPYDESERAKAETIMKNLRANEQAFIVSPADYEFGFLDMKSGSTRDLSPSILHHNREITKSVLAQFLELGATDSGSRALSSDQTDLFLMACEATANNFANAMDSYAIKQLVDLNFNDVEKYPKLKYKGISRVKVKDIADAYKVLTEAGGIVSGGGDEQFFREALGLPAREDDDMVEVPDKPDDTDPEEDDVMDDIGLSEYMGYNKNKSHDKNCKKGNCQEHN